MIRPLDPRDLPAVFAINQANRPAVGDLDEAGLAQLVEWADLALVVESEQIDAFLLVMAPGSPYPSPNYRWFERRCEATREDHVYVDRIAVRHGAQNQRLGSALYEELFRVRPGRPVSCEVNIRPMNAGSLRFHERHGFAEVGQQEANGKTVAMLLRKPVEPHHRTR